MSRSKNIHIVQKTISIVQPNDAAANWASGVIQVDAELSQELGRTIRNGNSFRLIGYGANLKGFTTSSDQDVGFAGTAVVNYCPVTKNGVGAHQKMYKQWTRQKQLAGAVGSFVRYDDFEVGWAPGLELASSRNSTILAQGMGDTNDEQIVLFGTSVSGDVITLEEYYDNLNPVAPPSEDFLGSTIKTAKFTERFPEERSLIMPTSFSATMDAVDDPDSYAGGLATGDINWLPSDNHLSHMTGTLYYYFKGVAPDTATQLADELKLTITLVYEGWSSLAPKTRSSKKLSTSAAPAKSSTRVNRRS